MIFYGQRLLLYNRRRFDRRLISCYLIQGQHGKNNNRELKITAANMGLWQVGADGINSTFVAISCICSGRSNY
jgi:hypothetical protein